MISDLMFETVERVASYLTDPTFDKTYQGELRERIVALAVEAEAIRLILDRTTVVSPEEFRQSEALLRAQLGATQKV